MYMYIPKYSQSVFQDPRNVLRNKNIPYFIVGYTCTGSAFFVHYGQFDFSIWLSTFNYE